MTEIRCTVDNCRYWGRNNTCRASSILVTSDAFGAGQGHGIDAPVADTLEATPTRTCVETCCKTFHAQGKGQVRRDDVSLEG